MSFDHDLSPHYGIIIWLVGINSNDNILFVTFTFYAQLTSGTTLGIVFGIKSLSNIIPILGISPPSHNVATNWNINASWKLRITNVLTKSNGAQYTDVATPNKLFVFLLQYWKQTSSSMLLMKITPPKVVIPIRLATISASTNDCGK